MKRTIPTAARVVGATAVAALALSGCGGAGGDAADADGSVTLTLAGWGLDSTPEFQTLADAFHEENPDVTVELQEYDSSNYDMQMTADLAAGSAPDLYVQKNLKNFATYQEGEQLLDVSDVTERLDPATGGLHAYDVGGSSYAVPYRQDSWTLFYNKDLFAKAGVAEPDGSWTWDDYARASKDLAKGLEQDGTYGTYQHIWQGTVQGFALAQTQGADLFSGDYGYLEPYYDVALDLQGSGAQVGFGSVTTNSLTYQAEFGTQKAAMMPMGSWYVATILAQQASGEADDFEWGMAPVPQLDASTTGTDATPVTFGDPTGLGINPAIDEEKVDAAKDFLAFAAGEGGATALAEIGITPALQSQEVMDGFFALDGMPTDDLSRFATTTHDTRPENPPAASTAALQNILNDAHTAIMSGSVSVSEGLAEAEDRAAAEAGVG